jgi:hypothetical protein
MKHALLSALLIGAAHPAAASEIAFMGVGVSTCAQFAKDVRADPETIEGIYFTWAQAYMSGINSVLMSEKKYAHNLAAKSVETQKDFIRRFCDQRPLVPYHWAVMNLVRTLPKAAVPQSN